MKCECLARAFHGMAGSLQRDPAMLRILLLPTILLAFLASACQPAAANRSEPLDMRTLGSAGSNSLPVEAPPMITEQATELRSAEQVGPDGKPIRQRTSTATGDDPVEAPIIMPFAPLIAMDPVDGSKVSIRVETPVTEYKNRLYYFGSAQNKTAFLADPERYATGALSKY